MKLKILTLILFIAVVIFIAIQEPIAAAIFAGIIIFLVVANSIDESKSTITQLENSIAKDKDLIKSFYAEREVLRRQITTLHSNEANHKKRIEILNAINTSVFSVCVQQEGEIANLNATITALQGTIDLRKKRVVKKVKDEEVGPS